MNRRSIGAAAMAAVLGLSLAACANPREKASSSDSGKFRIGLAAAGYGPYLGVYAAEEQGYFEDNGLSVEITAYQGGGAATEALTAGEADLISFNPEGVAVSRSHNIDQKLVGTGMATSAGWLVVAAGDSSVTSTADLDGKNVGIGNPGGTGEFFSLWSAKDAGVTWKNQALGYGALNENLSRGRVDAIVQLPPLSYQAVMDGGKVISDLGQDMEPTIPDGWVATDADIADNAEQIQAALTSIYQGVVKLQHDKAYALKLIEEKEGISGALAEEEYQSTIMSLSPDGALDPAWIENALSLASVAGLDAQGTLPPAEEIFTDQFVS
jgi:NitT/TauT family transport system substrate-binding protein